MDSNHRPGRTPFFSPRRRRRFRLPDDGLSSERVSWRFLRGKAKFQSSKSSRQHAPCRLALVGFLLGLISSSHSGPSLYFGHARRLSPVLSSVRIFVKSPPSSPSPQLVFPSSIPSFLSTFTNIACVVLLRRFHPHPPSIWPQTRRDQTTNTAGNNIPSPASIFGPVPIDERQLRLRSSSSSLRCRSGFATWCSYRPPRSACPRRLPIIIGCWSAGLQAACWFISARHRNSILTPAPQRPLAAPR